MISMILLTDILINVPQKWESIAGIVNAAQRQTLVIIHSVWWTGLELISCIELH